MSGIGKAEWLIDSQFFSEKKEMPSSLGVRQTLKFLQLPLVLEDQGITLERKKNNNDLLWH